MEQNKWRCWLRRSTSNDPLQALQARFIFICAFEGEALTRGRQKENPGRRDFQRSSSEENREEEKSVFKPPVSRYFQNARSKRPHIHVKYQGEEAVIAIPNGEVLEGSIQQSKMKLVQAWIEIHRDDLMADWELAVNGQKLFKIEPLK